MGHVAIMKKSWGLIPKILDGRKKIESRWGINKCSPWGKIKVGDAVYFKNSGEPVTVVAKVSKIQEFENLNPKKIREILEKYGGDDSISVNSLEETIRWAKRKRYCTLIYLKDLKKIKPFNIDKTGFGTGAAWLSVSDIDKIKI
jgi:ASC-1-like (ASCH) protein